MSGTSFVSLCHVFGNIDDNPFWGNDWRLSVLLGVSGQNITHRFHHCLHFLFYCVCFVSVCVCVRVWGESERVFFFPSASSKNRVYPCVHVCAQNDNEAWGFVHNVRKPGRCQMSYCYDDDTLFSKKKKIKTKIRVSLNPGRTTFSWTPKYPKGLLLT